MVIILVQITLEFDGWWGQYQKCNPVGNGEPWPRLNLSKFECTPRPLPSKNTSGCQHLVNAVGGQRYSRGGYWYNTPGQGQCGPGSSPGDGSGCTWRLAEVVKAINETCMRRHYGEYLATLNGTDACFQGCPTPWDVHGDCFLKCFAKAAVGHFNKTIMQNIWTNAFAFENVSLGGCPSLPPVVPSPTYCHG